MPEARHEVTIRRPASEVFAFLADGLNGPKCPTGILDIAHVSGTGVGATYKQGVKGPGGRVDADYRVTTYEPNSRLAFEAIAGPVRPKGEYTLEESRRLHAPDLCAGGRVERDQEVAHEWRGPEDDGRRGRGDGATQDHLGVDASRLKRLPEIRRLPRA